MSDKILVQMWDLFGNIHEKISKTCLGNHPKFPWETFQNFLGKIPWVFFGNSFVISSRNSFVFLRNSQELFNLFMKFYWLSIGIVPKLFLIKSFEFLRTCSQFPCTIPKKNPPNFLEEHSWIFLENIYWSSLWNFWKCFENPSEFRWEIPLKFLEKKPLRNSFIFSWGVSWFFVWNLFCIILGNFYQTLQKIFF